MNYKKLFWISIFLLLILGAFTVYNENHILLEEGESIFLWCPASELVISRPVWVQREGGWNIVQKLTCQWGPD